MAGLVVLVDRNNNPIGAADKDTIHSTDTPLHRGFSLFLFNARHELLVTRRSGSKKTFPGVWSNTVCGHPGPQETPIDAAKRRLKEELGIETSNIKEVAPYRYRSADKNGIVENEICPILVAHTDVDPIPNKEEVDAWKWMEWDDFLKDTEQHPWRYSPWCIEEAALLSRHHASVSHGENNSKRRASDKRRT